MIRRTRPVRTGPRVSRILPAVLLAGLLAGSAILSGCSKDSSSRMTAIPPKGVPVTVGTAVRKEYPVQVRSIGTVEAYSTVTVKTQVPGLITRVAFREGQEVRKGDLLFEIDPTPYRAALAGAEANLARDVALREHAEKESKRYASLIEKDLIPRQQFDQVTANLAALEATVQADAALVEQGRVRLEYCFIRSPIDGRTGDLTVNQGNVVKENDSKLVVIHRITPIYVTFSVPERRLGEIRKFQARRKLVVEAVLPGEEMNPIRGTLDFISNEVDKSTGTIQMKGNFANTDRHLWPGQFVNVALTLTVRPDTVLIPTRAIQTGPEGQYVFIVGDDLAVEMRPVVPGPVAGGETVIERGVRPGERVVTDGQLRLVPGARVEVKGPGAAGEKAS